VLSGAFSIRQLESGFLSPMVGYFVDRAGPRRVILLGVCIAGLGLILTGLSPTIWWFYLAFVLMSAGVSGASHGISWAVMVARWFTRQRGRATSLTFMGGALGAPGVILVAQLVTRIGWRTTVIGMGFGLWLVGIPLSFVARSRPQDYGYQPDGDPAIIINPATPNGDNPQDSDYPSMTFKRAARSIQFWALIAVLGIQQVSMGGLHAHQIAYFEDIGFGVTQAASTVAIAFAVSAIGRIAAGILTDWTDWRRVFATIILGQTIALLVLANVSLLWHAILFSVLLGLCHGMMVPIRPIVAGTLFGTQNLGSIYGAVDGAVVAMGVVGPLSLGWTFDNFNTYVPAFYIMSLVLVTAIPTVFLAFHRQTKSLPYPRRQP